MPLTEADVLAKLGSVVDPMLGRDFVSAKSVKKVQVSGSDVTVDVVIGYPAKSQHPVLRKQVADALASLPGVGRVTDWVQVIDVVGDGELVAFESPNVFEADGSVIISRSTLRFRSQAAIEASLVASGFVVDEVRDAPDRPGRELVFIALRSPPPPHG